MTETGLDSSVDGALTSRLGQIVIRWSAAEACLSHLLANLANTDPIALSALTEGMTQATLAQAIKKLLFAQLNRQVGIGEIIDHLTKADDLRADRNALVDGLWDTTGCEKGTCQVHSFKSGRSASWLVTAAELDELIQHINAWTIEFITLGQKFGFPRRQGETQSIFKDLTQPKEGA